ncbi:unnamed protein product, partial [Laminaria digitata]
TKYNTTRGEESLTPVTQGPLFMWLLRGWPLLLCLVVGAQATRCTSSGSAAFVPILPRLPSVTSGVVRPSRLGFNNEVLRKYSQALPGYHPSVLANKGLAALPDSGKPARGAAAAAAAATALRSLRMGGRGRTHERKDTRIGRNQDGGNNNNQAASSSSSSTQQPCGEPGNPPSFSAASDNSH